MRQESLSLHFPVRHNSFELITLLNIIILAAKATQNETRRRLIYTTKFLSYNLRYGLRIDQRFSDLNP